MRLATSQPVWSACVIAVLLGMAAPCFAAAGDRGSAMLSGVVRDAHGTPQMGALVELLAADASIVATGFTDDHGRYALAALLPGRYSLHATAAFLLPVNRPNLHLQAGAQAIVNLTMNTLFEAESWLPAQRRRADEPADDWKWALRSNANRPLLRFVDPKDSHNRPLSVSTSASERTRASSQARVSVTNGDGAFGEGGLHQVLVLNRTVENGDSSILRVDMGSPQSGFPLRPSVEATAGYEKRSTFSSTRLVTSYQAHPEVTYGAGNGFEVLRLASTDQMRLGDAVLIDAGTLLQAERLASSLLVAEPYARISIRPGDSTILEYRYATGTVLQGSGDLDRLKPAADILTDANGKPLSSKGSHHEISVSHRLGTTRSLTLAAYRDAVSHAGIAGSGTIAKADLQQSAWLADPTTGTFRVAAQGYAGRGVSATFVQALTPALDVTAQYSLGTALRAQLADAASLTETMAALEAHTMQAASMALRGKVLRSGTAVQAEYRWQPARSLTQVNAYNASPDEAFLGFMLRQRVWSGRALPGNIDAVVQATNLLEQGYTPVLAPDGHTLFLAQVPHAIMGGLAFNF